MYISNNFNYKYYIYNNIIYVYNIYIYIYINKIFIPEIYFLFFYIVPVH